jgi:hypothetical protein
MMTPRILLRKFNKKHTANTHFVQPFCGTRPIFRPAGNTACYLLYCTWQNQERKILFLQNKALTLWTNPKEISRLLYGYKGTVARDLLISPACRTLVLNKGWPSWELFKQFLEPVLSVCWSTVLAHAGKVSEMSKI